MSRPAIAYIDLAALRHNLARVKALAPKSRVMAVVKANAYGHGAVEVAKALEAADALAVASLEEAVQVRHADIQGTIKQPILLLEGLFSAEELELTLWHQLWQVVHNDEQLDILKRIPSSQNANVWLKLDTGMHRLGFPYAKLQQLLERVRPEVLMSHFASADEPSRTHCETQLARFRKVTEGNSLPRSLANSAAILAWPESHLDWVRPGIMLYGVSPFAGQTGLDHGLKPVMTLHSELISVKNVKANETVGYGGTWQCPEDMPVGVVAMGYADGYPRHAPSGTPVLVNGVEVPLVGRVSMDMITVDLRHVPYAKVGDPVTLWGQGLPIERVAAAADTIGYELLCNVSRPAFEYRL